MLNLLDRFASVAFGVLWLMFNLFLESALLPRARQSAPIAAGSKVQSIPFRDGFAINPFALS